MDNARALDMRDAKSGEPVPVCAVFPTIEKGEKAFVY